MKLKKALSLAMASALTITALTGNYANSGGADASVVAAASKSEDTKSVTTNIETTKNMTRIFLY